MIRQIMMTACLVVGYLTVQAQTTKLEIIEDEWGVKGEIRSSGAYSDTLLPKQGRVDIRWRELTDLGLTTYRVQGQTYNHVPVGKWSWEEADWNYTVEVGASIRPVFNAKGQRMRWEGVFASGKPDGLWSFSMDQVSTAGVLKPLMSIAITFKNGKPAGTIVLENFTTKTKVKGATDEHGVAKGTWSYSYKSADGTSVKEDRIYQKGLLTEIRVIEGSIKSISKQETNIRFLEKVGTSGLFEGKIIGEERFEQDEYGGVAMSLYYHDFNQFYRKGWQLDVFPFEVVRALPAFKKLEFPLTTEEKTDIAYSRQLISQQKDSISSLLSGNTYILRSRSGELDTTISFLEISRERLLYIDSLLNRTDDPVFTYKNRYEQGVQHWIAGLNQRRHKKGQVYDSLEAQVPRINMTSDSVNIFKELKILLIKNEQVLPQYYQFVESERIALKKEGELKELEDLVEQRLKPMLEFYSDKKGIGEEIYTKWIEGEIEEMLHQYTHTPQYEEALQIGNRILKRLDSLESWKPRLDTFDRMPGVLESRYRYLAYNPYTGANDIEITAKKRFINSVLNEMWPYMIKEMEAEQDWDKWTALWNRQFNVFNYLLTFVSREDAAAKRVESRVRKEKKPERMLKVILNQMDDH